MEPSDIPSHIPLQSYPAHYLTTLSLERDVERQQRALARTLRRIHAVDSSLTQTYQNHVSLDQPRLSLSSGDGAQDFSAIMEQVNSMAEDMPPGLGVTKCIGVNYKRLKHWALMRHAKKQDERLQGMRERLDRLKPPTSDVLPNDPEALLYSGATEDDLIRIAQDIKARAERNLPSHSNTSNTFGALLAARRAYASHLPSPPTPLEPSPQSALPASTLQPFAPGQALAQALQDLSELPLNPRPVVLDFKPDSETVAVLFAALRLAACLMLRLLVWACVGVREVAEWCEVGIAVRGEGANQLLQNRYPEGPDEPNECVYRNARA